MASLCFSALAPLSIQSPRSSSVPSTSFPNPSPSSSSAAKFCWGVCPVSLTPSAGLASSVTRRGRLQVARKAPQRQGVVTHCGPGDFDIEWQRSGPAKRPDIFPQFNPVKTPLPPPMPFDTPPEEEWVDEDEWEEEERNPEQGEQPLVE